MYLLIEYKRKPSADNQPLFIPLSPDNFDKQLHWLKSEDELVETLTEIAENNDIDIDSEDGAEELDGITEIVQYIDNPNASQYFPR